MTQRWAGTVYYPRLFSSDLTSFQNSFLCFIPKKHPFYLQWTLVGKMFQHPGKKQMHPLLHCSALPGVHASAGVQISEGVSFLG